MHVLHLPSFEFRRQRWRNGAGWTREILRMPAPIAHEGGSGDPAAPFDWRASIAEIDRDCTFSAFPDCDRQLVLLAGDGVRLQLADGGEVELAPPHGRAGFAGEQAPRCSVGGRCQVFNLIVSRARIDAELLHRPLVGPMVFFPEPQVRWLVLLLAGRAQLPDAHNRLLLEQGDAMLLSPEAAQPQRIVLSGGGEVLLARLAMRPQAPPG